MLFRSTLVIGMSQTPSSSNRNPKRQCDEPRDKQTATAIIQSWLDTHWVDLEVQGRMGESEKKFMVMTEPAQLGIGSCQRYLLSGAVS